MDPTAPWLLNRSVLSPLERAIFGIVAVVPLAAVWDLVIRPWPAALSPWGLLIAPIVLGALAISAIFGGAAVLAPGRELWVDRDRRVVIDSGWARWLGRRERLYPFESVEEVAIRRDHDTDGPDRLLLVLVVRGRKLPVTLLSRPLDARPEVESLADRLRAAIQA